MPITLFCSRTWGINMDIMEILIADECGVFDDDKDKKEREEEGK
jgi:hypothetical protein